MQLHVYLPSFTNIHKFLWPENNEGIVRFKLPPVDYVSGFILSFLLEKVKQVSFDYGTYFDTLWFSLTVNQTQPHFFLKAGVLYNRPQTYATNNINYSWQYIQRRSGTDVDFYLNWDSYVEGFGNPQFNYWIG